MNKNIYRKIVGDQGEDKAVNYLISIGYKILDRNYRSKAGEIDIIAQHDGSYIFIEVKTRRNSRFGSGVDAVTKAKQRRIILTANNYLKDKGSDWLARFDIISIDSDNINHIENAFSV